MSLSDEIRKLQELHQTGALTDEEFARAKAGVLSAGPFTIDSVQTAPLGEHLQQIRLQNEIERLDREWEFEREKYMITGRYGRRRVPSDGGSLLAALLVGGFGGAWTIFALSMGAPAVFPIFGFVFVVLGVSASLSGLGKAGQYQQAYQQYQQRRAELLAQGHHEQR